MRSKKHPEGVLFLSASLLLHLRLRERILPLRFGELLSPGYIDSTSGFVYDKGTETGI